MYFLIRSNQKFFNLLHVLSDGILVFLCFHLAYVFRFFYLTTTEKPLPYDVYCLVSVIALFVQVTVYSFFGLYRSQRNSLFRHTFWKLAMANTVGCGFLMMGLYFLKYQDVSRLTLGCFYLFEQIVLPFKRYTVQKILYYFRKKGYNQKHVILVGSGVLAQRYLKEIHNTPQLGYHVMGSISRGSNLSLSPEAPGYLGDYSDMMEILQQYNPDEVVVALSPEEYMQTKSIIYACEKLGIRMSMIPYYTQFFPANPQIDYLQDLPMLHLRPLPLEHFGYGLLKRSFDLVLSAVLMVLLSPLLLAIALGVRCSGGGGKVIFSQVRVGKDRKEFTMYKFRSMRESSQADSTWSKTDDPRKTKFGSFLRKCSLDELPQLWNVFKGDMSLVGPRPELPFFVEQFKEEIPRYMVKHQVRPGMTGWAQVSGFRGDTSIPQRIDHDLYYIEHWSLWFDLKILVRTAFLGMINQESVKQSSKEPSGVD